MHPVPVSTPNPMNTGSPQSRLARKGIEPAAPAIEILVDGRPVAAFAGESVAATLAAAGLKTLRATPAGGDRGLYCGMGACFECRVTIDGRPGQRACLASVKPGMQVSTGRQPVETSGVPQVQPAARSERCAVLVIGAGPAGLAAADAASAAGAAVVILDERAASGGQYFKPLAPSHRFHAGRPADGQFGAGAELIARVLGRGVRIFNAALVWDARAQDDGGVEIHALDPEGPVTWRAEKLVVATGAYERAWAVPGWTRPGVMTTGAAQTLSRAYRVSPGRRVLFAGNGPLNLQVAADLARDGVEVVAVAEGAASPFRAPVADIASLWGARPALAWRGLGYLATLRRRGVPVLYQHVLVRVEGTGRAERAVVAAIDDAGALVRGSERAFEVDTVCTGYGFAPSNEVTRLLGCSHAADPRNGVTLVALHDQDGRTSVRDVFIAGDAGGPWGAHAAIHQGTLAGAAAAADLAGQGTQRSAIVTRARQGLALEAVFQDALWRVFAMPRLGDRLAGEATLACRCENVTFGAVRHAIGAGERTLAGIKRATRCGMGPCQGRYCSPLIAEMLTRDTGLKVEAETFFRAQAPLRPVPLDAVARPQEELKSPAEAREDHASLEPTANDVLTQADILVIGGGVIGLSVARELARVGRDVAVLERGLPHAEASGVNAGSLHVQYQTFGFPDLGTDAARASASTLALQRDSVYLWDELANEVATDFEIAIEGGLTVADDAASVAHLEGKVAVERRAGLAIDLLSGDEARRLAPYLSQRILAASLSRDEGKLNPLKAVPAVLAAALAAGVRMHTHTQVLAIERTGEGFLVRTTRGVFPARIVVNAAGAWAGRIAALAGDAIPVRPNPIQMLVTEALPPMIPYHLAHATRRLTLKQAASGNLVIGGGWKAVYDAAAGRMRPSADGISGNLDVVYAMLPGLGAVHVIRSWTGIAFTTAPVIGESGAVPGLYHAVAQNGMTLGPAIGRIVAGQVIGRAPEYDLAPFSPRRFAAP